MKKMNKRGGFTLIELLVVIAIIGILSSVVLVSLNSARSKGKDTHIISGVNQLRTQIESDGSGSSYNNAFIGAGTAFPFLGTNTSGSSVTTAYATYNQIFADLHTNTAATVSSTTKAVGATALTTSPELIVVVNGASGTAGNPITGYSIHGYLSTGVYFCIDSTGNTNPSETVANARTLSVTCL
ncbi:MAG: type II secretion system protein [Patescibacteria group bacterium]